jgi:hypothetical protein
MDFSLGDDVKVTLGDGKLGLEASADGATASVSMKITDLVRSVFSVMLQDGSVSEQLLGLYGGDAGGGASGEELEELTVDEALAAVNEQLEEPRGIEIVMPESSAEIQYNPDTPKTESAPELGARMIRD